MPESWFELSSADQSEALEVAAGRSGRPAHLLEKDIWVVWALSAIYDSPLGNKLTFKGGTWLSKVYKVIDRFSEDIDLTYDIRKLVSDLLRDSNPIPRQQARRKRSPVRCAAACRNGSSKVSNPSSSRRWWPAGCKPS